MKKWIPKLKRRGFSMKGIGAEGIIVAFSLVMFLNIFVRPRIHPYLAIPAIIAFLALCVVMVLPSQTNEQKTTFDGLMIYMKFISLRNKRNSKQIREDVTILKIKNFFNRGNVEIKKNVQDNKHKVNIASLEDSGIEDIYEDSYKDKRGNVYYVYMYEFKNINGISRQTDLENLQLQAMLFDSLEHVGKLHFPFYNSRPLEATHSYFMDLKDKYPQYREEYEEMLMWITFYNNKTQTVKTIDVSELDHENFLKNSEHLDVHLFTGNELIKHLHDRQSGGEKS